LLSPQGWLATGERFGDQALAQHRPFDASSEPNVQNPNLPMYLWLVPPRSRVADSATSGPSERCNTIVRCTRAPGAKRSCAARAADAIGVRAAAMARGLREIKAARLRDQLASTER
jgi:hypothetical protein